MVSVTKRMQTVDGLEVATDTELWSPTNGGRKPVMSNQGIGSRFRTSTVASLLV
jgi:hypothetical protein